ncbi:MAG: MaoC family dehydratase N-terminal domain-containing protein [Christensenellaceae bacterium]|jgi:acyl dehydratase|nr:MaoC family dehydratase N-terminal domain-containing protein [Christensenellaceae bacterium]
MYFDEMEEGRVYELPVTVIDEERMLAFAKAYDPLPVHTDEAYARQTHFGGLIAPGVMSFMAVWRSFLDLGVLDRGIVAGMSNNIEWLFPVRPGDRLSASAQISSLRRRNHYSGIAEITVRAYNEAGKEVFRAVTRGLMKDRPAGGAPARS